MEKIYQVTVIGIEGQHKTVDVAKSEEEFNDTTVLEFKKKLSRKLPGGAGDNPSEMRLLFMNKQLEDDKKFSDYQIKDKSTLAILLRMRGG